MTEEKKEEARVEESSNKEPAAAATPEQKREAHEGKGVTLSTLITTAIVTGLVSMAATLTVVKFFPPAPKEKPTQYAVVDMVRVATAIAQKSRSNEETEQLFAKSGESIRDLRNKGFILLDARMVIAAPEEKYLAPSDLIPGVSNNNPIVGGWQPANPFKIPKPTTLPAPAAPQPGAGQ